MPQLKEHIEAAAATYAREIQGNRLSFIAFKQAPWYLHARLAIERSQLTIRTPYFDNDLVALSFRAPPETRGIEPALRLIAAGNPALKDLGTDRASRLRSIPGVTFARHQLQEFTFKAEYAYDYGMPQWLARMDHLLAPFHCEKLFLGRHKFYHFRVWYRDELSRYVRDILLDARALRRTYLNARNLEKLVLAHASWSGQPHHGNSQAADLGTAPTADDGSGLNAESQFLQEPRCRGSSRNQKLEIRNNSAICSAICFPLFEFQFSAFNFLRLVAYAP